MYYNNPIPQVQMQPQRTPLQQQPSGPYPKREKRITDHATKQNINNEILATPGQPSGSKQSTLPQSGLSSARAMPVGVSHSQ